MTLNTLDIMGNLVRDPETRYTTNGTPVASFSIGHNESENKVSFFTCTAYGKTAENVAKCFHKGQRILIHGRITQDRWTRDGVTKSAVIIIADMVFFADPKPQEKGFSNMPTDTPFI